MIKLAVFIGADTVGDDHVTQAEALEAAGYSHHEDYTARGRPGGCSWWRSPLRPCRVAVTWPAPRYTEPGRLPCRPPRRPSCAGCGRVAEPATSRTFFSRHSTASYSSGRIVRIATSHRRPPGLERPGSGQRGSRGRVEQFVEPRGHQVNLCLTRHVLQGDALIRHARPIIVTVEQARNDRDPALLGEVGRGLVLASAEFALPERIVDEGNEYLAGRDHPFELIIPPLAHADLILVAVMEEGDILQHQRVGEFPGQVVDCPRVAQEHRLYVTAEVAEITIPDLEVGQLGPFGRRQGELLPDPRFKVLAPPQYITSSSPAAARRKGALPSSLSGRFRPARRRAIFSSGVPRPSRKSAILDVLGVVDVDDHEVARVGGLRQLRRVVGDSGEIHGLVATLVEVSLYRFPAISSAFLSPGRPRCRWLDRLDRAGTGSLVGRGSGLGMELLQPRRELIECCDQGRRHRIPPRACPAPGNCGAEPACPAAPAVAYEPERRVRTRT